MSEFEESFEFDSEEELVDFQELFRSGQLAPYQFEPEYTDAELQQLDRADTSEACATDDRVGNTDWCTCTCCVTVEKQSEAVCCREVKTERMQSLLNENGGMKCVTHHPGFEAVCLNPWVLETAHGAYIQQYGPGAEQGPQYRRYRHIAHRQFVQWIWGHLGRSIRVPLPSCIVSAIRSKFSSDDSTYVGFKYPDLK